MSLHLCIPVLRRYDLLNQLLLSLADSTIQPDRVWIINNGKEYLEPCEQVYIHVPDRPLGVAESWNWFLRNVPEERVISNDDIVLAPHSLEALISSDGDIVWAKEAGFSLYLIRDTCLAHVGEFDETISPGYAYYEDEDYVRRLQRTNAVRARDALTGATHLHSQTWQAGSPAEQEEHWRKFNIAKSNFEKKWGDVPERCQV